jgi:hypothetical protein
MRTAEGSRPCLIRLFSELLRLALGRLNLLETSLYLGFIGIPHFA